MSRLTRKQVAVLERALRNAERAQSYLMAEDMAVGRLSRTASTTLHFTRADGLAFYPVQKEYGSDLVGLQNCIAELRAFLRPLAQAVQS